MPRAHEILAFLREAGATRAPAAAPEGAWDAEVTAARPDDAAGPGDLAWLSPKRAAADPGRVARFAGSLLLVPEGAEAGAPPGAPVVPCRNPKVAFSRAVHHFLPHLAETRWPAPGGGGVAEDAVVGARVRLAPGVVVGSGTVIHDDVEIGPNTVIANATVHAGARIGANCSIGLPGFGYERDDDGAYVRFPHVGRVVIGEGVEIGSNTCVDRGALGETRIERGAKIDNLVHVAHNVVVGEGALVIAHAVLGGSVRVGAGAWVAPGVSVLNQLEVGAGAVLGMGAMVVRPVAPGATVVGNPARPLEKRSG